MAHQVSFQDHEVALVASTSTQLVAAGSVFSALMIYNKDPAATIYVTDDGEAASATLGLAIGPGTGYEWPEHCLPQAAVNVFSTGTPRVFFRYA